MRTRQKGTSSVLSKAGHRWSVWIVLSWLQTAARMTWTPPHEQGQPVGVECRLFHSSRRSCLSSLPPPHHHRPSCHVQAQAGACDSIRRCWPQCWLPMTSSPCSRTRGAAMGRPLGRLRLPQLCGTTRPWIRRMTVVTLPTWDYRQHCRCGQQQHAGEPGAYAMGYPARRAISACSVTRRD